MTERRNAPLGALIVILMASTSSLTADAQSATFWDGLDTNPVADPFADIVNCKDLEIFPGEELEQQCTSYCGSNATEHFDWADSNEDFKYVVRNTVCRCFANLASRSTPGNKTFECWSKAQVWDKQTPIMKCTDHALNITSQRDCEEFCSDIDPVAYGFTGSTGRSRCSCSDILVCDDIGAASGMAIATSFVLLLGTVTLLW